MPIYEYRCKQCNETSEILVLGKGDEPRCKKCDSPDLVKLLSAHNTMGAGFGIGGHQHSGGCCGTPNSCGMPGSCCSG